MPAGQLGVMKCQDDVAALCGSAKQRKHHRLLLKEEQAGGLC